MITFPNCKINLGLNIVEKKNGYHDLETFFFPVNIRDALEILPSKNNSTRLSISGIPVDDSGNNICIKAYDLVKEDIPGLPGVNIHLHKAIPLEAGLGGGSSDGAFTLQLLNKIFNLNIPQLKLGEYALKLGSDCPFFLVNRPCFARGRGEKLETIDLNLSEYKFVVINPGIRINTAQAFKDIIPKKPVKSIKQIIKQPADTWKNELMNDFEKSVFNQHPVIKELRSQLYENGAAYASMSGSGSTIYGIFEKNAVVAHAVPAGYFYKIVEIPDSF